MKRLLLLLAATAASVAAAQDAGNVDYVEECPVQNGFFADAVQCDRYYECKDGEVRTDTDTRKRNFANSNDSKSFQILDKTCPDGLVFDESSIQFAKCSFPFSINCAGRQLLQTPQPTPLCPRQNGYFPHQDPNVGLSLSVFFSLLHYLSSYRYSCSTDWLQVCDRFYFCVDGVANPITCPSSLVFDPNRVSR